MMGDVKAKIMCRNIVLPEQPPREARLASIHEILTQIERKPGARFGKDSYTGRTGVVCSAVCSLTFLPKAVLPNRKLNALPELFWLVAGVERTAEDSPIEHLRAC